MIQETLIQERQGTTHDAPARGAAAAGAKAKVQIVLVLQGGGALGSYQAGVFQGLHEAGVEPDWVVGTSIGAINAALIAGNAPGDRTERLSQFWSRVGCQGLIDARWSLA